MKNAPMRAARVVVSHCEPHGHVMLIFRDRNGVDLAHAHMDVEPALGVTAQIQERAVALEQSRQTAGHA